MGFYKLKPNVGSHLTLGEKGKNTHHHANVPNDPLNSVVESDEPLDVTMPEKFDKYTGPMKGGRPHNPVREIAPPLPPDQQARTLAGLLGVKSAEERKAKADELRKIADRLEEEADEKGNEKASKEANEHQRTLLAESDQATAFEEEGRKKLEYVEKELAKTKSDAGDEDDGLDKMTIAELDKLGEKEEVDFTGRTVKADKIAAIREKRNAS